MPAHWVVYQSDRLIAAFLDEEEARRWARDYERRTGTPVEVRLEDLELAQAPR